MYALWWGCPEASGEEKAVSVGLDKGGCKNGLVVSDAAISLLFRLPSSDG